MKLLAKMGLFSLLAGATASVVYGDPQGGWLSPNGQSGGAASSSTAATIGVDLRGTMPLVDMRARVSLLREQTRIDARHIQHLQQVARQGKDVIKLNCVNDKLVQVKPQMNIADAHTLELESSSDGDRVAVFEAISVAAENVHRLREEADQCIGEPVNFGFESSNSFTGPTAPDDPTKGFSGNQIEPPGYASPFN
jgi:hypothetical protein